MSEKNPGAVSGPPARRPRQPGSPDVFDVAVLDRTLDEDWSRYTGPAADVRARGLRIRRTRRFRSVLGVAGALAVTVMVVVFAPGRAGVPGAASPAAVVPTPSAGGLPTPPHPWDQLSAPSRMVNAVMTDATAVGTGIVDGHDWLVRIRVFPSMAALVAQAPGIDRLGAAMSVSPGSTGPVAVIANYENGKLGGVRVLTLMDGAPIIPDGRGTAVDPWFSRGSGVVTGQIDTTVGQLEVVSANEAKKYTTTGIDGYRFIAFPVSAAAPVKEIWAYDVKGNRILEDSGHYIPDGVFDSAHPELNFGMPTVKS